MYVFLFYFIFFFINVFIYYYFHATNLKILNSQFVCIVLYYSLSLSLSLSRVYPIEQRQIGSKPEGKFMQLVIKLAISRS